MDSHFGGREMKNGIVKREAAPAVVQGGKLDFSEVVAHCQGDGAALIRWHIEAANALGRMSLAHAIFAGWLLERQKVQVGYGGWGAWCEENLDFSQDTADRYVALYRKTVGAARTPAGIGAGQLVSAEELEAATEAVDASTATGAMVELGILKRKDDNWGGDRRKAAAENGKKVGRPAANPDPAADAVKVWTLAAEGFRRITPTSYRFLPLREAEGLMVELDAVRDRLRARIAELKSSAEVAP